jgi:hypothetical protein
MPPPLFPGADGLGVRRWTIAVVGCLFAVWAGATLSDSPYLVFAGLAGLLYVGTLSVNARALAWLVIALQPAALIVPFFPGRPFWWELCALLAWPSLLAHFLVNRQKLAELRFDRLESRALLALLGYVGVLGFLMMYRGVGFRAFGGGQMGGRVYAQQMVLAIVPLLMVATRLSPKQVYTAAAVGWTMSLTYVVAEFTFVGSGGVMQKILYFFELPTDGFGFISSYAITGVRRYGSFAGVATAGLACIWTLAPLRDLFGRKAILAVPLVLGLFGLGLGSGYRNALIIPALTFIFLTWFQRFWTFRSGLAAAVALAVLLAGLYATADQLPLSVQRSISFLPEIEISHYARADAKATNIDRMDVLELALADVPKYWLAGRGFGMERVDQAPLDPVHGGAMLLYSQGMFYNGFFGSLLKTGVVGLLFSVAFVWFLSWMAIDLVRLVRERPFHEQSNFDRFCFLICAQWFAVVTSFYLTNGDVNWWMQQFGLPGALIMLCRRVQQDLIQNSNALTQ